MWGDGADDRMERLPPKRQDRFGRLGMTEETALGPGAINRERLVTATVLWSWLLAEPPLDLF